MEALLACAPGGLLVWLWWRGNRFAHAAMFIAVWFALMCAAGWAHADVPFGGGPDGAGTMLLCAVCSGAIAWWVCDVPHRWRSRRTWHHDLFEGYVRKG